MRKIAIIVIPANEKEQANNFCKTIDVIGGSNTFATELSPNGLDPITHYWCGWNCTDEEYIQLQRYFGENLFNGMELSSEQVLQILGLHTRLPEI
jgi:hypothetical protein